MTSDSDVAWRDVTSKIVRDGVGGVSKLQPGDGVGFASFKTRQDNSYRDDDRQTFRRPFLSRRSQLYNSLLALHEVLLLF